ncbi:unnamed protein product [Chironomus riparius]|uniref:Geminin n=1 Tax=Chironomus riparius TaxID=315576 RepID=A0A9N9WNM1_9DIPT|nr:unnamed protein product [Chironomus riparius]
MASSIPSKIFIQVESQAEQQENIKNTRKVFNNLQKLGSQVGTDKENLIGRSPAYIAKESLVKKASLDIEQEVKRKSPAPTTSKSSQTSPALEPGKSITTEDLTSDKPVNQHYWEVLAEKRREALQETLVENQELYERIANLEDELNHSKSMLEEARDLVTVLTEMLEEKESPNGPANNSVETEEPSDTSGLDFTI